MIKRCYHCHLEPSELKRCARCKAVWFCNKECQRAGHKQHRIACKDASIIVPVVVQREAWIEAEFKDPQRVLALTLPYQDAIHEQLRLDPSKRVVMFLWHSTASLERALKGESEPYQGPQIVYETEAMYNKLIEDPAEVNPNTSIKFKKQPALGTDILYCMATVLPLVAAGMADRDRLVMYAVTRTTEPLDRIIFDLLDGKDDGPVEV